MPGRAWRLQTCCSVVSCLQDLPVQIPPMSPWMIYVAWGEPRIKDPVRDPHSFIPRWLEPWLPILHDFDRFVIIWEKTWIKKSRKGYQYSNGDRSDRELDSCFQPTSLCNRYNINRSTCLLCETDYHSAFQASWKWVPCPLEKRKELLCVRESRPATKLP